jgi:hypothetical protein
MPHDHRFSSASFHEIAEKMHTACDWLNHLGIRTVNTRINKYKELIDKLSEHLQSNKSFSNKDISFPRAVNMALEIAEIVDIYDGLRDYSNDNLRKKLSKLIDGVELRALDPLKKEGRRISFELMLASRISRSGVKIHFTNECDILFEYRYSLVVIECKYLQSYNGIQNNIKKATKQLDTFITKQEALSFGIIALNISNIINPDHR